VVVSVVARPSITFKCGGRSAFGKSVCADVVQEGRCGGSRALSPQSKAAKARSSHRIDIYSCYLYQLQGGDSVQSTIISTLTLDPKASLYASPRSWPQQSRCLHRPSQRHLLLVNRKASIFSSPPSPDLDSQEHSPFQSHQTPAYATFFTPSMLAFLQMSTRPSS